MLVKGVGMLLALLLASGCCTTQSSDLLRKRQYDLDRREARLKAAEAQFKQCVVKNYPGQDPGLEEPPPATSSAPDDEGDETNISAGSGAVLTPEQYEEVKRVERVGQRSVVECYEEQVERTGKKKLEGKVGVKILIGTSGTASRVTILQSSFASPPMHSCIVKAIRGWDFPKVAQATWYTTTFRFSPAY